MSRIQYDDNMKIAEAISKPDVQFYNVDGEPFSIHGVWRDGESYCRVPLEVAKNVSKGILDSRGNTAGGRVRFKTDSPYIAIKVEYGVYELSTITSNVAMVGFDVYADDSFAGVFRPPVNFDGSDLISVIDLGEANERVITINMPLYSEVKKLFVGVAKDSKISHAPAYKHERPMVFYGSSITNGAAASRPGATYTARLSRMLDSDYHSLGFGGLAKGEPAFAEYISGLDMSLFVLDYDHNARTLEHLQDTHERFFKIVRDKNPNLPIVIISRPNIGPDVEKRFEIIKATYDNAVANGDKNVYLIKGIDLLTEGDLDFTADKTHPSDLGYYFMAKGIYPIIRSIIE